MLDFVKIDLARKGLEGMRESGRDLAIEDLRGELLQLCLIEVDQSLQTGECKGDAFLGE